MSSTVQFSVLESHLAGSHSFGVTSLVLNLIPIAGFAFSITSTVGAALWAGKLERTGSQFERKPENERPGAVERDAAKVEF